MMDKAKLINKDFPLEIIMFDINPDSVSMAKGTQLGTRGSTQPTAGLTNVGHIGPFFQNTHPTKLTLNNLIIEGALCKNRADLLIAWMQPYGSWLQQKLAMVSWLGNLANMSVNCPTLIFQWGPPIFGFVMECKLSSISMKFTRFAPLGTPTRLKIASLELTEVHNPILYALTNPTSGGLPGRTAHMVTEGENLQSIAKNRYGSPGHWRALADANDVDDPMRVRPGDSVYLPSPQEVIGRDGRPRTPALPAAAPGG